MPKLYEISQQYIDCFNQLEEIQEDGGMLDDETVARILEPIKDDFKAKALATGRYILELESDIAAIKVEADRLSKMIAVKKARIDTLMKNMENEIRRTGIKEAAKDDILNIRIDISKRQSVRILDEASVPDEFCVIKKSASKELIGSYLKSNGNTEWAEFFNSETLKIK